MKKFLLLVCIVAIPLILLIVYYICIGILRNFCTWNVHNKDGALYKIPWRMGSYIFFIFSTVRCGELYFMNTNNVNTWIYITIDCYVIVCFVMARICLNFDL